MIDKATKKTRVLLYNWCPLGNREGGGVSLYIENIVQYLVTREDVEVFFLNSGFYYDEKNEAYIRPSASTSFEGVQSFDLVNSPVIAPMKSPSKNIEMFLDGTSLKPLFAAFLAERAIDVVHFNNLEGLELDVLTVKNKIKNLEFIYSLHNYAAFCPAVNLWKREGGNCFECDTHDCATCMSMYSIPTVAFKKANRQRTSERAYEFGRLQTHIGYGIAKTMLRGIYNDEHCQDVFNRYRTKQVEYINKYMDVILAVSKRVAFIAESYGIDPSKLHVAYIGTRFAEKQTTQGHRFNDNLLHLAYLGYMKEEKGLSFLLDALESLDNNDLARLSLTIAAKMTDPRVWTRIQRLKKRIGEIIYYNGYTHEQLPNILSKQELGVVPVLWEDNLPQIALEFAASGVPVLASSFGGASELSDSPLFKFKGADQTDFGNRIKAFLNNKELLDQYWDNKMHFPTLAEHGEALIGWYRS